MMPSSCAACGGPVGPDMVFCPTCGSPMATAGDPGPATGMPWRPVGVSGPVPVYSGAPFYRLPMNPRQIAAVAAAALLVIAGAFFLFIGAMILHWDAVSTDYDPFLDEESLVIDPGPFLAGVICVIAYALSLLGAYVTLRLSRLPVAVLTVVFLVVAYLCMFLDAGIMLVVFIHQLVLALAALWLLIYARPLFPGLRRSPRRRDSPFEGWGHG